MTNTDLQMTLAVFRTASDLYIAKRIKDVRPADKLRTDCVAEARELMVEFKKEHNYIVK